MGDPREVILFLKEIFISTVDISVNNVQLYPGI